MLSRSGMGDTITSHVTDPSQQGRGSTNDDLSPGRRNEFDTQVENKLKDLYERAHTLISDNRWFLVSIAHALQTHRTISGEDIDAIYRGAQGPTLDGRLYHSEQFRHAMVPYLQQARAAHTDQSQLLAELPFSNKPDPSLEGRHRVDGAVPVPAGVAPTPAIPGVAPQPGAPLPGYAGGPTTPPPGQVPPGGWPQQPPRPR
jgi:hypothetical protein